MNIEFDNGSSNNFNKVKMIVHHNVTLKIVDEVGFDLSVIGLQLTFGYCRRRDFQHYSLIELQMFDNFRQPNSIASAPLLAIHCYLPYFFFKSFSKLLKT